MAAQSIESQSIDHAVNGDKPVSAAATATEGASQTAEAETDTLQIAIHEASPFERSWHTLPFPLGSISSGQLRVKHIQSTVGLMLDFSASEVPHLELLFGQTELQDENAAVRDYGVQNRSEIEAWTPKAIENRTSGGNWMTDTEDRRT
jgi:hypothetical protein